MTILNRATAIGVFPERAAADAALEELRGAGFAPDQLGFVVRDRDDLERTVVPEKVSELSSAPTTTTGAMGGGLIGGLAGAAASLLVPGIGPALAGGILFATLGGAAMGAVVGGFAGSLVHLGVSEEEARGYQDMLTSGHTIVTVRAPGRYEEALSILRRHGAYNSAAAEIDDVGEVAPSNGATPAPGNLSPTSETESTESIRAPESVAASADNHL